MLGFHAVLPGENASQCWVSMLFYLERTLQNARFPCCSTVPGENAAKCYVSMLFYLERMLHNAGFSCCSSWRECCTMLGFHAVLPGENAAKCWVFMLFFLERMLQNVEFQLWAASGLETVLHRRKPRGSCPPSAT